MERSAFGLASKFKIKAKLKVIHKVSARIDLLFEECIEMSDSVLLGGSGLITAVLLGGFVFKYKTSQVKFQDMLFKRVLKMSVYQVGVLF